MSTDGKMDLEELKKSFPSLDELSASKLLGGMVPLLGGELPLIDPGWGGDPFSSGGANLNTIVIHHTGGAAGGGGGGSSYFGDWDWGDDGGWGGGDWSDDGGWGDDAHGGGWGDDEQGGGDTNPGGGSEQNSSENPGGEQGDEDMTFPSFSILWGNYPPDVNGAHAHPSVDSYPNQCAIRVGYALIESGVDLSSYPQVNQTTDGYPRSSKGLADWLWQNFGPPIIIASVHDFQTNYSGQTGLFFEYANPGYTSHIDLWNAGATGSGFYTVSYQAVWFWPIN